MQTEFSVFFPKPIPLCLLVSLNIPQAHRFTEAIFACTMEKMSSDGSITVLLQVLKNGLEEEAAQDLFQRYFQKLEQLARPRVANLQLHDRDEQDVAQVVMTQFFLGVREGRFPKLNDRDDLWQVLMLILERRVIDLCKRAREPVCNEFQILATDSDGSPCAGIDTVASTDPSPETIVELKEELHRRLEQLPAVLRQVAVWRLEGRSNAEIAGLLDRSVSRVEHKLRLIRQIWTETNV